MSRDPEQPLTAAGLRFWGLFAVALGALVMLATAGMFPSKGGDAPPWVVACAASSFVFAGSLLVLRSFMGGDMHASELPRGVPLRLRVAYYALGLAVVGALATVGTWVAFGPGERAFAVSLPFLGSGPANPWIGRAMFGVGAVLTWLFFVVAAVAWWRKLVRGGFAPK
jgi:hypothetical protein